MPIGSYIQSDAVKSEDVPLEILRRSLELETTEEGKQKIRERKEKLEKVKLIYLFKFCFCHCDPCRSRSDFTKHAICSLIHTFCLTETYWRKTTIKM